MSSGDWGRVLENATPPGDFYFGSVCFLIHSFASSWVLKWKTPRGGNRAGMAFWEPFGDSIKLNFTKGRIQRLRMPCGLAYGLLGVVDADLFHGGRISRITGERQLGNWRLILLRGAAATPSHLGW